MVRKIRGGTYENRANLAPGFFDQVIRKYEGTRLGRQELLAEVGIHRARCGTVTS